MNQSPLRLERYALLAIRLEPAPNAEPAENSYHVDFDKADFTATVNFSPVHLPNGEPRFAIDLTLEAKPKADVAGFPYSFFLQMVGFFDGQQLPEATRHKLVVVNGASMLYSAARDMLVGLSLRSVFCTVLLPSVSFAYLADQVSQPAQQAGDNTEATSQDS